MKLHKNIQIKNQVNYFKMESHKKTILKENIINIYKLKSY